MIMEWNKIFVDGHQLRTYDKFYCHYCGMEIFRLISTKVCSTNPNGGWLCEACGSKPRIEYFDVD